MPAMFIETDLFHFDTGAATHEGRVRDHNEDSFLIRPDCGLWVVADGMGGHAAGEVASGLIVAELNSVGIPGGLDDLEARFHERLSRATHAIMAHAATLGGATIGSTLVALLQYEARFACLWAGDSRAYQLREGRLIPLTADHTEVNELLRAGAITADEARTWPRRNVITRAIGVGGEPDCERVTGEMVAGATFLLCSDGLTEHLKDEDIAAILSRPLSAQGVADALIAETLERGATDNVTAIVLRAHAAPQPVTDEE